MDKKMTGAELLTWLQNLSEEELQLPIQLDSAQISEGAWLVDPLVSEFGDAITLYASLPRTYEQLMEVGRLQQWVNDLQAKLYINCVYCGHRYGPDESGAVPAEALTEHVKTCPKHPLAKALADLEEMRKERDFWHRRANEPEQDWSGMQGGA